MKRLDNVKLAAGKSESELIKIAKKSLGGAEVKFFKILKKSLDARDKKNIFWQYSIAFSDRTETEEKRPLERIDGKDFRIAVVGSGPAGLFCALRLIERGFAPVIIDRGEPVEDRRRSCVNFFEGGKLNPESNVQFGEGGAGAFSDGKLNTGTKDGFNAEVLDGFVRFGAPPEIAYLNKPHVGSDKLYGVLKNIRAFIERNGGKYLFNTKLTGINSSGGALTSLVLRNVKDGTESELEADCAVLAIGHSARDTFEMLNDSGVLMQPRDFAIGVRIEHLAAAIGFSQYGEAYKLLPTADYKLVSHAHERTVFTFCMCPGGVVIPAASEDGGIVVNGMSLHARDGINSNSALMVQMRQSDFGGGDLFAGMRFQRAVERKAFEYGGGKFVAPCQLYGDFACGRISDSFGEVKPTYAAGTRFAPLEEVLPKVVAEALMAAIPDMGKRLKGFDAGDALMTGVETRFSSPVRILRDGDGRSVSIKNLYPCGEGSGYSGGITSSAADGIRAAERIFERFKN